MAHPAVAAGLSQLAGLPASHASLLERLARQLLFRDPTGEQLAGVDDLDGLADATADGLLDSASAWEEHLGPFYDGAAVRSLLADGGTPISRQAVHKRRGLLALTTGSGQVVYPARQFRGSRPAPSLGAVLDLLPEALVSPWTVASWLFAADPELAGDRPIDLLHDGGSEGAAAVLRAAEHWAGQLASAA